MATTSKAIDYGSSWHNWASLSGTACCLFKFGNSSGVCHNSQDYLTLLGTIESKATTMTIKNKFNKAEQDAHIFDDIMWSLLLPHKSVLIHITTQLMAGIHWSIPPRLCDALCINNMNPDHFQYIWELPNAPNMAMLILKKLLVVFLLFLITIMVVDGDLILHSYLVVVSLMLFSLLLPLLLLLLFFSWWWW